MCSVQVSICPNKGCQSDLEGRRIRETLSPALDWIDRHSRVDEGVIVWKLQNQTVTRIDKANAVVREQELSNTTKLELSNTAKLSVFKAVFVPIFTCGHESCAIPERILFQVEGSEMGFLRRVHGVELREKMCSCEIRKTLNVEDEVGCRVHSQSVLC